MQDDERRGKHYDVKIDGGVSGQVGVGENIRQRQTVHAAPQQVSPEDLAELRRALADVRAQVEAAAPPDQKGAALERVDELAGAATAEKPDLTTMEYVRGWFARHLPQLAGAITSIVVHPIVGKLVEAAGDSLAEEWRRRFGGP
jgi:hypothetical protein